MTETEFLQALRCSPLLGIEAGIVAAHVVGAVRLRMP